MHNLTTDLKKGQ